MRDICYVLYMYIVDFVKLYLVFWGVLGFTPRKQWRSYFLFSIVTILILIFAGLFYQRYTTFIIVFLLFLVVISICFLFREKFFKNLAFSLLTYIAVLFLDACITGIFAIFLHSTTEEIIRGFATRIICNSSSILIIGIIIVVRKTLMKQDLKLPISKSIYTLFIAGVGSGILILTMLMMRPVTEVSERARKTMIIITIIVVISYCVVCIMMSIIMESRDNYKALSLINQRIIESQQMYYQLVNEKQQEIGSVRHEMKNHVACIAALFHGNKLEEMENYINQLVEETRNTPELLITGNDISDAILNDARNRYCNENIDILLDGMLPRELLIEPTDLCVIFANTIINAVEALQRMEHTDDTKSLICVKISCYKEDIYIDVTNPVREKVEIKNGSIETIKGNKALHGFGIHNVQQRVARYEGSVEYSCENNLFRAAIYMKNKKIR